MERQIQRLTEQERHESMRGYFAFELHEQMRTNDDIWLISVDLGFAMLDRIKDDFPDRFINTAASEQAALGIAVGLAEEGKKPFVYTISSFYLRAAETISLYVDQEQVPVIMLGAGRDGDYAHDGPSHHGGRAQEFMQKNMANIDTYFPVEKGEMKELLDTLVETDRPSFVSLNR